MSRSILCRYVAPMPAVTVTIMATITTTITTTTTMVIVTATGITTTMTEHGEAALLRLMTWLSPAFPVGSFSYSHGLERAVHDGLVAGAGELQDWLEQLLEAGSAWNDAVLFAESWRRAADEGDLMGLAELA